MTFIDPFLKMLSASHYRYGNFFNSFLSPGKKLKLETHQEDDLQCRVVQCSYIMHNCGSYCIKCSWKAARINTQLLGRADKMATIVKCLKILLSLLAFGCGKPLLVGKSLMKKPQFLEEATKYWKSRTVCLDCIPIFWEQIWAVH